MNKVNLLMAFFSNFPLFILGLLVCAFIPSALSIRTSDSPVSEMWVFPILLAIVIFMVWFINFGTSYEEYEQDGREENEDKNENFSPLWKCKCGITNDLRLKGIQCECGKFYGEIQ